MQSTIHEMHISLRKSYSKVTTGLPWMKIVTTSLRSVKDVKLMMTLFFEIVVDKKLLKKGNQSTINVNKVIASIIFSYSDGYYESFYLSEECMALNHTMPSITRWRKCYFSCHGEWHYCSMNLSY